MKLRISMNKIIFVVLSLIFSTTGLFAQELSPSIENHEEGSYRTLLKKSGRIIWQASWVINKETKNEKKVVTVTEKGHGYYNNSKKDIHWLMESSFIQNHGPRVLETTRVAYSSDDKEIWKKDKIFDYSKEKLIARQFVYGKLRKEMIIPMPGKLTFSSDILAVILRGYDFDKRDLIEFYIFSSDAKLYNIIAKVMGKESITVPAGTFECHKMELTLDLGIFNLALKPFLPKTYMWFTVAKPHIWLKYEGLESGIGTPYIVMELTKFRNGNVNIGD